jgi:hypothetical protein
MMIFTKVIVIAALIGGMTLSTQAFAAKYVLSVAGKVDRIVALQNSVTIPTPRGIISAGDNYTLEAHFDTSLAELNALFDADPTVNIYNLPGAHIVGRIGNYAINFSPPFSFNSTTQLWNNRIVVTPTDSQSFSFFNFNLGQVAPRPFFVGNGLTSESLNFNAFDFTATARNSDLISELPSLSAFSSWSLTYAILNSDTNLFVQVSARVTNSTLSAVPEPTSWMFMITGLGAAGCALRLRRRNTSVSTFRCKSNTL